MSATRSTPWPIEEVRAAVLALNDPQLPVVFSVDGDKASARWKFDDPAWASQLDASTGASRGFSYTVRLAAQSSSFRWFEQDAGFNNGRLRLYRGYSRGVTINLFTLLVGLVRRLSRSDESERGQDASETLFRRDQVSGPLLDLLDRAGWKNRGVTI